MAGGFRIRIVAAATLCGSLMPVAEAAPTAPVADETGAVRRQLDTALANIQFARCGPEARCAPATAAESADPPLTIGQATSALDRGALSGLAKVCKLDWIATSFRPMLDYWRGQRMDDRQIALIGILHGMALARTEAMIGSRPCTDKLRRDVEARLPNLP